MHAGMISETGWKCMEMLIFIGLLPQSQKSQNSIQVAELKNLEEKLHMGQGWLREQVSESMCKYTYDPLSLSGF